MIPAWVGLCSSPILGCNQPPEHSDSADSIDAPADSTDTHEPHADEGSETASRPTSTETATSTESETDTTTHEPPADLGSPPNPPNEDIPPPDEEGCPALYAQDRLPTFELTLTPDVWAQLNDEWATGAFKEQLDLEYHPLHPVVEFKYEDIVITNAMIRLRGNPNHWSPEDKLQFHIDFNENDKHGRFQGLRTLALDAATFNRHMLRDRLSLWIMRRMGIQAPCANNARLNVNGEYYGIYTNVEKLNKDFLERVFDDPSGDLWQRANWELETNQESTNATRLMALKGADSAKELEAYLDVEQALQVYAAEAILPDSDGMWAGGLNYYLYDDPLSGKFLMLPWDLDNTFERFKDPPFGEYPANPDPIAWEKWTTHGRPFYDLALAEDEWFYYYIDTIETQVDLGYEVDVLHDRIDAWTEQIQDAVYEDENKPFSDDVYDAEVEILRDYVEDRAEFLDNWLACWANGGQKNAYGYCIPF